MGYSEPDVVIVGAGIAGGALGVVLARAGFEVVLLERENSYPDRVRGEFMVPWGVTELAKLELLQPLREAGALFTKRNIPYDEIFAPAEAEARALDLTKMHAEGFGGLCLGHPATCESFAQLATTSGASVLRGTRDISITSGSRPSVSCVHDGAGLELRTRLVIGADGRNSTARKNLGFKVNTDEPHNLLGGMLVKGVPS
ncbi:MAG: FAD-dependent monooxygenase [Bradyrhizobium sp.]